MNSSGTIFGRLSHKATPHSFDHVTFYVVKQNFPAILGREFFTGHQFKDGSFALAGSGLNLTLLDGT